MDKEQGWWVVISDQAKHVRSSGKVGSTNQYGEVEYAIDSLRKVISCLRYGRAMFASQTA